MAGTVGHMQPCLRVPRFHGRRGSGQGEWRDTEGPGGGGVTPLQPRLLRVSLTDTVGVAAQSC